MIRTSVSIFCICAASVSMCVGQGFRIDSLSRNGQMTWTDSQTNGHYRIEWCSSLMTSNWLTDWSSLSQISATGGVLMADVPMLYRVVHFPESSAANNIKLRLVSAGGQPGGPQYNFYMSKYEITTEEFIEFLNNAEANQGSPRGANMYFTDSGDIYMDSSMTASEMMFDISDSYVFYNDGTSLGERFWAFPDANLRPITGVSWYGSLKFCNWTTLAVGRGESARCYSEGVSPTNWIPAHISYSSWADGFDSQERWDWNTECSGFRLPMDDYTESASYFNEFHKAGAWNGSANSLYGFGRDTYDSQDGNYDQSGDPYEAGSTPVGYYDGTDHGGIFQTRANGNLFGVFDLTSNVREWSTDAFLSENMSNRSQRGGSWRDGKSSLTWRPTYAPNTTADDVGFRIVTMQP